MATGEAGTEALTNTKDNMILVGTIIATFTHTAGINPPGGVYQDGPLIGTAVAAQRTAFKVFTKHRKFSRHFILAAISFMATAYGAAYVVTMVHIGGLEVFLLLVFVVTGLGAAYHRIKD
ncbi:hypothetical protein CDL12_12380 [Handroanthus impetiginosus]|uniref:PGG domain-containing protein n=1 Tax=Handroanthus impetiginosus TaxID=429701 RepID=A0A2G9HBT2_9LAMI|nr:hypothetical protein CDL12_12380 [Handroanthus impetiginosus]